MTSPGQPPQLRSGSSKGRVFVVIPSYGVAHLTRDVVSDVLREPTHAAVLVIDNEGDYRPVDDEVVWRPGQNLGWLRASNAGMRLAFETGATAALLLNNDTRLSEGFFAGLVEAQQQQSDAVLVPLYDDISVMEQHHELSGDIESFVPRPQEVPVARNSTALAS